MDAAACNATARKRDVNRFGSELGLHGGVGEFFATGVQKRLDLSLCLIDSRTAFSLLFRREAGQTTHQRSDGSVLADVLCFGVFERGILLSGRKSVRADSTICTKSSISTHPVDFNQLSFRYGPA